MPGPIISGPAGMFLGSAVADVQFQGDAVQPTAALTALLPEQRFDKQERAVEGPPLDEYYFDLQSVAASSPPDILVPNDSPAAGRWIRHTPGGGVPAAHALGGAEHSADTLANLNTKVSDATLVDSADAVLRNGTQTLLGDWNIGDRIISGIGRLNPAVTGARDIGTATDTWRNIAVRTVTPDSGQDLNLQDNGDIDQVTVSPTETTFNTTSSDQNHRFKGDTDPDLLTLDGALNRTGIGVALGAHLAKFQVNGGILGQRDVEANTAVAASPNAIVAAESRRLFTNEGATAENHHDLPSAVKDLEYTFVVQDVDGMQINAATGDTIRLAGLVSIAAGLIESVTIGSSVTLVAINATEWIATSIVGVWDVETS